MKTLGVIIAFLLLASLAIAAGPENTEMGIQEARQQVQTTEEAQVQAQGEPMLISAREPMQIRRMTGQNGEEIQLESKQKLRVRDVEAHLELDVQPEEPVQERAKLQAKLSNGRNAEIKVMPNTASETAIARLRLKVCAAENNCTIELKEVGSGEEARAAYEIKAQKEAKVFGIFRARMNLETQIDAETGEVIRVNRPWWAAISTEE